MNEYKEVQRVIKESDMYFEIKALTDHYKELYVTEYVYMITLLHINFRFVFFCKKLIKTMILIISLLRDFIKKD